MLDQVSNPRRKLPDPPRPVHPLCPERVTLDVFVGGLLDIFNVLYHSAAALILAMPAWLRFLASGRLINADVPREVVTDLLPLHTTLVEAWECVPDDPALTRQGQAWPADAAKESAELQPCPA
jgi:hypothetical protein